MNGASQSMIQPKYVALDTSTWIDLFKRRTDPEIKDIIDILNSGQIIPYVCFEHILELSQYDDQKIREQQLDFFGTLNLISFPTHFPSPPWRNSPLCASYQGVQESEISALLNDPNLSLEQVVERARPLAVGGLSSGKHFANDAVLRDIAKTGRAISIVQLNRAAASMIHSSPQNPNEVIPQAGEYTMLNQQAAEQFKPQLAARLAQQFRLSGDPRLQNPDRLAAEIVELAFQQIMPNYNVSGADPFREFVSSFPGLALSRLPAEATADDFFTETLYRSRMAPHERRMRLENGAAYKVITRERLPSMVVWFALERETKSNKPTAEGGNMIDFPLAALALYIDRVQVDKRVLHHVEVAARKNPFLERIRKNVFRAKDLKSLSSVLSSL